MSTAADLTVVVVVWDGYCDFLGECLASALAAQDVVAKALVVDNASERTLPAVPARTKIIRSPERLTVGAARNLGLAAVDTPYVTFLDADDVLLPGALALLRDRLARRPRAVAAIGRYVTWNDATDERRVLRRAPKPVAVLTSRFRRVFALANLRYNTFPVVGCVHRTAAVRAAGGFGDADVGEDWILGALLCFRGRILFDERPTFLRRVHQGSLWYRPQPAEALLRRTDLLRSRVAADDAVPRWAKAALPLLGRLHHRDVRRAVGRGPLTVDHPFLAAGGGP